MTEEEIAQCKWQKRLYKPTGPDGKGWGDFRKLNALDLEVLQEFQKQEEKDERHRLKIEAIREQSTIVVAPVESAAIVVDEDKRWEAMFRLQL